MPAVIGRASREELAELRAPRDVGVATPLVMHQQVGRLRRVAPRRRIEDLRSDGGVEHEIFIHTHPVVGDGRGHDHVSEAVRHQDFPAGQPGDIILQVRGGQEGVVHILVVMERVGKADVTLPRHAVEAGFRAGLPESLEHLRVPRARFVRINIEPVHKDGVLPV